MKITSPRTNFGFVVNLYWEKGWEDGENFEYVNHKQYYFYPEEMEPLQLIDNLLCLVKDLTKLSKFVDDHSLVTFDRAE